MKKKAIENDTLLSEQAETQPEAAETTQAVQPEAAQAVQPEAAETTQAARLQAGAKRKTRVRYKDMTPLQKKKKRKRDGIIAASVFLFIGLFVGIVALTGYLGVNANMKMVEALDPIGCELTPEIDEETGFYTFVTDGDFKVLQLTDIHIGGGGFSIQKDNWALNAVYTLVKNEKPDLVVVSGDIAYPVPFQGTLDNKREAILFATLMERMGVYWAPVFGNHDTEVYSIYDREQIGEVYGGGDYKYCLFQAGPDDIEGTGNYIVNVKNTLGMITQSIVLLDSHSYTDGDIFGAQWKYDNLYQNQIDWYEAQITALNNANIEKFNALSTEDKAAYASVVGVAADNFATSMIKSSMFFHIPLTEYKDAWTEYVDNGYEDTENVKFKFGVAGETGKIVYSGIGEDEMFETILSLGSTQGIFCGHDHYNNFSLDYKGVRLTYGMSIDYLAYMGIAKKTEQRGGTLITYSQNGGMELAQRRLSDY
jgi:hypothetical protein